jgi:hypothetical protein
MAEIVSFENLCNFYGIANQHCKHTSNNNSQALMGVPEFSGTLVSIYVNNMSK